MSAAKILMGPNILGRALGVASSPEEEGQAIVSVITGKYDTELKYLALFNKTGEMPTPEDLDKPFANQLLEQIKSNIRLKIQQIFEEAQRADMQERDEKLKQVRATLSQSNAPHPLGTVSQLAAKAGVSKSEIRRLREAGQLESFLASKGLTSTV